MTQPYPPTEPMIEGVAKEHWQHRCQGSERDVKEAKFLLAANVATLFSLKEYYNLEPLSITEGENSLVIFLPFFLSTFMAIFALAAGYARERAIYAILSGRDLTVAWGSTVAFAKSRFISRALTWSFLLGTVIFCAGILLVVLLAEHP